tara:strand:+ start:353 stop:622 length:270 start_codon:yes stop_codon:yes gene_type:complete
MAGTKNSGRKPNEINIALIQKLTPLDDIAFEMLKKGIEDGKFQYLRLWFLYRFGKAREYKDVNVTSNQETPLFKIIYTKSTSEMELENQ